MAFDDLELPTTRAINVLGGAATYSAYAASLYCSSRVVAVVGDDFSESELEALAKRGIDITGIERVKGKTFRWVGRYSADLSSRVTLDTQLNVFAGFQPKLPQSYRASSFVFLANIHPALQLQVLGQVERPKFVLADTMNFWIEGEPELLDQVLAKVDVLCVNDEEARQLSGVYPLPQAAKCILAKGPKTVLIKRGEHGCMLVDQRGIFWVPAVALNDVVDPTGAGDSFAGALIGYLASQGNAEPDTLRRALYVASAVASFNVQGVGTARLARLTARDVSQRVQNLVAMTHLVHPQESLW